MKGLQGHPEPAPPVWDSAQNPLPEGKAGSLQPAGRSAAGLRDALFPDVSLLNMQQYRSY